MVRLAAIEINPRTLVARVPFVVLIIAALGAGLGVTLWLSTDAAERSYQLGSARQVNQALIQQKEALERDVLEAQAAPALAEAARKLGMIPSRDTAHLVQDGAGNWVVVGTPKPAEGVPPPPLNAQLADPAPPAPQVVEPLEVPVRIPAVTVPLPVPGLPVPGLALSGAPLPGPAQALPAVPLAPAAPLVAAPGVEVPHTVAGQVPTPGPVPLVPPGASNVPLTPPADQFGAPLEVGPTLLSPGVASEPGAPLGNEQLTPVPGESA